MPHLSMPHLLSFQVFFVVTLAYVFDGAKDIYLGVLALRHNKPRATLAGSHYLCKHAGTKISGARAASVKNKHKQDDNPCLVHVSYQYKVYLKYNIQKYSSPPPLQYFST